MRRGGAAGGGTPRGRAAGFCHQEHGSDPLPFFLPAEPPQFVREPERHITAEMEKVVDIPCRAKGNPAGGMDRGDQGPPTPSASPASVTDFSRLHLVLLQAPSLSRASVWLCADKRAK